jgi:FdhD protein
MKTDLNIVKFQQFRSGKSKVVEDGLIVESPVMLFVNGELWLTFMCTPNQLEALAVGFLYNEGVIGSLDQVADIHVCDSGDIVDIWLDHNVEKPKDWKRTSGCTGGYTAIDLLSINPEFNNGMSLESNYVRNLVERLFESQSLYNKAGGVHTSILTDGDQVTVTAEDVGRHNSLDKIAGKCLLENITVPKKILLTTGRISSDMLQKSARIGAPIVISRTSPTSMSVDLAEKWGITLIGYARRDRFNLYTHPGRIIVSDLKEVYHVERSASP